MRGTKDAEIARLGERISELYRAQKNTILSAKSVEYDIDALRAAAAIAAGEIARLKEALEPFAAYADAKGGSPQAEALRQVVCAIVETPYPGHLTALHEFCVACQNARAALASLPQGEVRVQAHGPFPGAPFSPKVERS